MSGRPVPTIAIPKVDHPQEDCSWCWYTLHPLTPFPSDRSSTCCPEHCAWIITDHAHKREEREARPKEARQ